MEEASKRTKKSWKKDAIALFIGAARSSAKNAESSRSFILAFEHTLADLSKSSIFACELALAESLKLQF